MEAFSIKLCNKTAFIDHKPTEGLMNTDNRPRLNVSAIVRDFLLPSDFDVVVGVPKLVDVDCRSVEVPPVEGGGLINVVEPPGQVVDRDTAHKLMLYGGR